MDIEMWQWTLRCFLTFVATSHKQTHLASDVVHYQTHSSDMGNHFQGGAYAGGFSGWDFMRRKKTQGLSVR